MRCGITATGSMRILAAALVCHSTIGHLTPLMDLPHVLRGIQGGQACSDATTGRTDTNGFIGSGNGLDGHLTAY